MTADEIWLAAMWPFVRGQLPDPPSRVIELGCGQVGGHIPALLDAGYQAVGIDPEAPDGPGYRAIEFEKYRPDGPVDGVLASLSLHHVADPGGVLSQIAGMLRPGGTLVVVEWGWDTLDEATARWCFSHRLPDPEDPDEHGTWLGHLQAEWADSGRPWPEFCRGWAEGHGLHPLTAIQAALAGRFTTVHESRGPYYFPELAGVSPADEQAAIDDGRIRAGCLRYAGHQEGGQP
ncbi:MAG TPA: class I SAM-dependent methyltransferase [Streptosporangiaceae bacterium]